MEQKNQLFIHPTDNCGMNCSFCIYTDRRTGKKEFPHLDLEKGYARESMKNLIKGAQHTAFSGGGEPLLNVQAIEDCMKTNKNKKFMITTGMGVGLEKMEESFSRVNEICKKQDSYCVIRLSIDSFHNNLDFGGNLKTIIKWFLEKRWERVRTCFFRGTVSEGKILLKNLKKHCKENKYSYFCKKINKYTYAVIINHKFFQVILRPTIYPSEEVLEKEETMLKYIDRMLKIDTEEIILGKPRSCRGCKGCDAWKSGLPNGLDITVNAKGDIYLYGAEICSIGNIYDELITYELLNKRVNEIPEFRILHSHGIREVMEEFLKDEKLGKLTNSINYPFAVIREEVKEHKEEVLNVIRRMDNK